MFLYRWRFYFYFFFINYALIIMMLWLFRLFVSIRLGHVSISCRLHFSLSSGRRRFWFEALLSGFYDTFHTFTTISLLCVYWVSPLFFSFSHMTLRWALLLYNFADFFLIFSDSTTEPFRLASLHDGYAHFRYFGFAWWYFFFRAFKVIITSFNYFSYWGLSPLQVTPRDSKPFSRLPAGI